MFIRHWKVIFPERGNVTCNCLFDIGNRFFTSLSLTNATRETWTFRHEKTIFA